MSIIKLDDIDKKIIELLLTNSRISNYELAQKLLISSDIVKEKVQRLLEGKIITYFTIGLNSELILEDPYYIVMIKTDLRGANECITEFSNFPEIRAVHELLQSSHLLLITSFLTIREFHNLLLRLRTNPFVKEIDTWPVTHSHKMLPPLLPKKEINIIST